MWVTIRVLPQGSLLRSITASPEKSPINQTIQRERFSKSVQAEAYKLEKQLALATSWNMYDVETPLGERIFCVGITTPSFHRYQNQLVTLGINPITDLLIGFSLNQTEEMRRDSLTYDAGGSIATAETGKYYGAAIEIVRQTEFKLYAKKYNKTLIHTVGDVNMEDLDRLIDADSNNPSESTLKKIKHFTEVRNAWMRLYDNGNLYGYIDGQHIYLPNEAVFLDESALYNPMLGFKMTIAKKNGETIWSIEHDDARIKSFTQKNLDNSETIMAMLNRACGMTAEQ